MSSKIHYRGVPENNDYLLVDVKCDIARLTRREDIEQNVYSELQSIYYKLFIYEHGNNEYIKEPIAIRKDSTVGNYILSNPEYFENDDLEVTYDKICGAYLVATYEENTKMANKLLPLIRKQLSGSRDELGKFFNFNVLDYVLSNGDYKEYLSKINGEDEDSIHEYYVYEDSEYSKRSLTLEKANQKVKCSANS